MAHEEKYVFLEVLSGSRQTRGNQAGAIRLNPGTVVEETR